MSPEMNFDAQQVREVASNQDILDWIELQKQLVKIKAQEAALRTKIVGYFFPAPTEGTNYADLGNGYRLKIVHKIIRNVDTAMFTQLLAGMNERGIDQNELVEFKPNLRITNYKRLTDEQRAFFDQCVTAKPGSASLEFVPPKDKK